MGKNYKFYLLFLPVLFVSFLTLFLLSGEISPVSADPLQKVWVCKYSGTPGVDEFLKPGKQPIDVNANSTDGATVGNSFADAQGRSYVLALKTDENTGSGNSYIGDEKCPEGDIPTPEEINPIFECWKPDPQNENKYIAYFGWENTSGVEQTIPYGEYNQITPSSFQNYFPTFFNIPTNGPRLGRTPFYPNAAIEISNWDGNNIVWKLTDQGTATAGLAPKLRCPEQEPEYCLSTTTTYEEWSDWMIDPEDDTQEYRERTYVEVDAEYSDISCSDEQTETEYRPIEDEGEGEVMGETDEKEVLGTTTVVSADTAGGSVNPMIALIEYVLVIFTGISFIFLGKKELNI